MSNPAVAFKSLCVIDGDSRQADDATAGILRLPGTVPELEVFDHVRGRLGEELAVLTVSCQRAPEAQNTVLAAIEEVARTNRDPHLLFMQVGIRIGFVPETIVRGAFLALWMRANRSFCDQIAAEARRRIES